MSQANTVDHFEKVADILIYVACSGREISLIELQENVIDMNKGAISLLIRRLVKAGYLKSNGLQTLRAYSATTKTKELFGV